MPNCRTRSLSDRSTFQTLIWRGVDRVLFEVQADCPPTFIVLALPIPLNDIQRLSNPPLKWLRYGTFAISGILHWPWMALPSIASLLIQLCKIIMYYTSHGAILYWSWQFTCPWCVVKGGGITSLIIRHWRLANTSTLSFPSRPHPAWRWTLCHHRHTREICDATHIVPICEGDEVPLKIVSCKLFD